MTGRAPNLYRSPPFHVCADGVMLHSKNSDNTMLTTKFYAHKCFPNPCNTGNKTQKKNICKIMKGLV